MGKYKLSPLLFFLPFLLVSGFENVQEDGWSAVWGGSEIALGVAVIFYTVKEISPRSATAPSVSPEPPLSPHDHPKHFHTRHHVLDEGHRPSEASDRRRFEP